MSTSGRDLCCGSRACCVYAQCIIRDFEAVVPAGPSNGLKRINVRFDETPAKKMPFLCIIQKKKEKQSHFLQPVGHCSRRIVGRRCGWKLIFSVYDESLTKRYTIPIDNPRESCFNTYGLKTVNLL